VLVSDFHYELPEELIAQEPLADRAGSRLLHLVSSAESACKFDDRQFRDFPELLKPSDLVVFNNTRVFPARLYGQRGGVQRTGNQNPQGSQKTRGARHAGQEILPGRIEVLLTRQLQQDPNEWECLVRPGRKIGVGERLFFGEHDELHAEVMERGDFGERRIRFAPVARAPIDTDSRRRLSAHEHFEDDFYGIVEKIGHIPLPPYIARDDSSGDRERYQTVYARERGSVAAPTAGLHFTPEILERMRERGIETAEVTLHVGLGTFQPVRSERVEEHELHAESYSISAEAAKKINRARAESRRIVAVGTTTVRTLEYAMQQAGEIRAASGEAKLFIYPGFRFQIVQALLTNFHLPQSTLLMLVCALAGKENVMRAYEHAVHERYRFYSYGDCMFVES
jgi:S-adenosylmethionine:tRNA ribosyltransferase-isomerase